MTSAAKGNHWRVAQLFEESAWFGRGEASFRLFQQPLVPVLGTRDGRWLLDQPLKVGTGGWRGSSGSVDALPPPSADLTGQPCCPAGQAIPSPTASPIQAPPPHPTNCSP
jgi:hypothetical protein